jgi:hypothetical protein
MSAGPKNGQNTKGHYENPSDYNGSEHAFPLLLTDPWSLGAARPSVNRPCGLNATGVRPKGLPARSGLLASAFDSPGARANY